MTIPLTVPLPGGERARVRGYTLLEVVLAVIVVAVSVAATMLIMSKMMSYTANRGQAVDIANAVTISQMAIDTVRNQKFPPTGDTGDFITGTSSDIPITITNIPYTYKVDIVAASSPSGSGTSSITTAEYDSVANTDSMLSYRNLLKITVTIKKNNRPILVTVTYKTRNGYY